MEKLRQLASLLVELVADAMNYPTSEDYERVKGSVMELYNSVDEYDEDRIPGLKEIEQQLGVSKKNETSGGGVTS